MKILRYILTLFLLSGLCFAQQQQIPNAGDNEDRELQFFFKGKWIPDMDPAEIGAENYKELQNLRYGPEDVGLEGVQGYSKINTTALTTYTKIRSAAQLRTDRTTKSYVVVQAENSGETASVIYENQTAIPDQGDFEGTAIYTEASGAGLGRFAVASSGDLAYCNGVESLVYAGDEMRVPAFYTATSSALANPVSYFTAVNNTLQTTGNTVAVGDTGSRNYFVVFALRPLQAVKFYVKTANEDASTLAATYWNGTSFAAVSNASDGTKPATIALAQTGTFSFDSTVSTAKPYHFEGVYLYAYRFYLDAGDATIYHVSVDAPMQPIVDLWDAIPRQPIQFKIWRNGEGSFKDYTLEVNESSYESLPYVAQLDYMATADYMVVMADDRLSGINFSFLTGWVNENAATPTVYYWSGSAYTTVGTVTDGTALSGATMGQNGMMWWNPPAETSEAVKTEFGVTGYSYKIAFSAQLSGEYKNSIQVSNAQISGSEIQITTVDEHHLVTGDVVTITGVVGTTEANGTWAVTLVDTTNFTLDGSSFSNAYTSGGHVRVYKDDIAYDPGDVAVDLVTGATAQKTVKAFKFPVAYKSKLFLCGDEAGKRGERCDYSVSNTTAAWNGQDSSDDGTYSLYFGGSEPLTGGVEVYNQYGSRVMSLLTMFKDSETYSLIGDSPEDFVIERVSPNIGCPAPLTIASAEVGYELAKDVKRNMVLWLSDSGPYSFDGQLLSPIKGIDKYFDPDDDDHINFDAIATSRGWYDRRYKEYNLLIPSGTSQTTNNVWLVYDLIKKKWFTKSTGDASMPQMAFPVVDQYGTKYTYGAIDSGSMMRLENGTSWDGTPIEQIVETGDFWPTGNIWDLTQIRKIKMMAKRIPEAYSVNVSHFSDTDDSMGLSGIWQNWDGGQWNDWEGGEWVNASLFSIELSLSDSINRIARDTVQDNLYGWAHRFEFSISTDDVTKGLQPLGWGVVYQTLPRRDE